MKSKFLSLLLLLFLLTGCSGQSNKTVKTIDTNLFAEKLHAIDKPQLLDVRTPEEFRTGKIENARNLDWNDEYFEAKADKLDKTQPIFVYCKAGGRSAQAADKLAELGFTEIYNLEGGIMKWEAAGLSKSKKRIGITNEDYLKMLKSDKKVLVDFSAEWCGPCKKMAPYLERMKNELKDELVIIKIDADQNKSIVNELGLEGLPTLILYQNGKQTWKNVGFISEEELKKHL